jgi:hypothetical protein
VIFNFDPYVPIHKIEIFFIAINIDNITLYGPDSLMITNVKNILDCKLEVTDLGDL